MVAILLPLGWLLNQLSMTYIEHQEKLERIKALVEFGNTGTPKELANTLNISERTARRLIGKLKELKVPIEFCRKSKKYLLIK